MRVPRVLHREVVPGVAELRVVLVELLVSVVEKVDLWVVQGGVGVLVQGAVSETKEEFR